MSLILKNPHSILAVLRERPAAVQEIALPNKHTSDSWNEIAELANRHKIRLADELTLPDDGRSSRHAPQRRGKNPREVTGRPAGGPAGERSGKQDGTPPGRQSTACARIEPREPSPWNQLCEHKSTASERPPIWLALDCIQDPHNTGAIFRSAAFFGVSGILLTEDRSAPLSATVYDVAAGGVEYVPHSLETNLARSLELAKTAGLWILGTDERAELDLAGVAADRPWLVVLGNEENGLRRLTREKCDQICRIVPGGKIPSLNVSVAAGVILAALNRK